MQVCITRVLVVQLVVLQIYEKSKLKPKLHLIPICFGFVPRRAKNSTPTSQLHRSDGVCT